MIKRFYELQERVLQYYPEANIELLKKAYTVATAAHLNQKRASDEPYIIHPLAVAGILSEMRLDEISIAAGLLHDVLEDSDYTREQLTKLFGSEISDIVWGVTKISKISDVDVEDAQAETLKKMILAMTGDVRVILIKLADRLHNIRTLEHLDDEKRRKIARETLEIYAPIAHRLGMGKIRDELEDVSFQYAFPADYQRIHAAIGDKYEWAIQQLEGLKKEILKLLREYRIPAEIEYRIKREISIYRKQQRQNIDLDQVYDLMALRIITDTVANCYAVMGMIHQQWTHIPSRWRDFHHQPQKQLLQVDPHNDHHPRGCQVRNSDPRPGDAPKRRRGDRRPLEIQGGHGVYRKRRPPAVVPGDDRVPQDQSRSQGIPQPGEKRSDAKRNLRLHSQGKGDQPESRIYSPRLRLCHPLGDR